MPGVSDWIKKAASDLKSSKKLAKDDDETLDTAAYHTQQAAEKALKAYLVFKGCDVPKTHDLERLLKNCIAFESSFSDLRVSAESLQAYATYTRYPDDYFRITRYDAEKAIECASNILAFVKTKIELKAPDSQQSIFL